MEEEYDYITSYHYAQYRPPLHELILAKCLPSDQAYAQGLDIGCGTGRSTVALSAYCEQVIGIDPSRQMLQNALPHPTIDYQHFDGKSLAFADRSVDLVTFAGSLFYAKSQQLLDETIRVSKDKALIIVYDFELHLKEMLQALIQQSLEAVAEAYNHAEDFAGLSTQGISMKSSNKEETFIAIRPYQLTHLLLSDKAHYQHLSGVFSPSGIEKEINEALVHTGISQQNKLRASIYYTVYERLQ